MSPTPEPNLGTNLWQALQARLLDMFARFAAAATPTVKRRLGELLANATYYGLGIRRQHVESALCRHLNMSGAEAAACAPRIYRAFFTNALEMASIPYFSRSEIENRLVPSGLEHLQAARAVGKGVILVSFHYGLWELIPPWLVYNGFPITSVVRRQNNRKVDAWMEFMRTSHGAQTTDSGFGIREILRTLRQGNILGLMSDQDSGTKGIFVPFLGKMASSPVGPAQISRKTGAPIIVTAGHPQFPPPHRVEFSPPIFPEAFPAGPAGDQALTRAYIRQFETWIHQRPEQWFWLHRRWKTQPEASDA
jgi:KDO2-lipid IV(A) lauroyltransferase